VRELIWKPEFVSGDSGSKALYLADEPSAPGPSRRQVIALRLVGLVQSCESLTEVPLALRIHLVHMKKALPAFRASKFGAECWTIWWTLRFHDIFLGCLQYGDGKRLSGPVNGAKSKEALYGGDSGS